MKNIRILVMSLFLTGNLIHLSAQQVSESDFHSNMHPRIFVTAGDKEKLLQKIEQVGWAKDIYESLKQEVDPILVIHKKDPSYVISRMQIYSFLYRR